MKLMTRKDMTLVLIALTGVAVTTIILCLIAFWVHIAGQDDQTAAPGPAPKPPVVASEPTTLRAIRVEEHLSARVLTLYVKKVIPYDKLLVHADGALVRDRSTGEEFRVIFEEGLSFPGE